MRHFYGLQDNKIIDRAFALSNVFFTTTETTGTIVGTGATAGCHEVTYPHTFLKNVFWAHNATHYIKYCQQESKIPTSPRIQTKKICKFVDYILTKEEAQNVSSHQKN